VSERRKEYEQNQQLLSIKRKQRVSGENSSTSWLQSLPESQADPRAHEQTFHVQEPAHLSSGIQLIVAG
jgi:hypothetical protein